MGREDLSRQQDSDKSKVVSPSSAELQKVASSILHDNGIDIGAFGEALNSICQSTPNSFIRVPVQ